MSGHRRVRSKSSLAIVERAYRGSVEEQYGHIVWLSRVMQTLGANTALLLKGDATLYARRDQPRVELSIGDVLVNDISHYESSVEQLLTRGVPVYAWEADLLPDDVLVPGVQPMRQRDMPLLISRFDCVWYW